jgi:hypothetical protein
LAGRFDVADRIRAALSRGEERAFREGPRRISGLKLVAVPFADALPATDLSGREKKHAGGGIVTVDRNSWPMAASTAALPAASSDAYRLPLRDSCIALVIQ